MRPQLGLTAETVKRRERGALPERSRSGSVVSSFEVGASVQVAEPGGVTELAAA